MKKRLKITEGKAVTLDHNWSDTSIVAERKTIATISIYDEAVEDTQEALEDEMSANAELIADAFNTANETQLLPSELKEQSSELKGHVDDLIRVLQDFISSGELIDDEYFSMEIDQAKELINKIKDNE